MQSCKVLEEIKSYGKDKKVYAKKGEKCSILFRMGDMLILENSKGERFGCKSDKVYEENK